MATKIICELGLTEVEVQALRALIGATSGGDNECNDALSAVYEALNYFHGDERIPRKFLVWDSPCGSIHIKGWK